MNTSGVPNAPNPGTSRTFRFDLNDRTFLDVYPLGPPEDDLMVSYTSVPQDVLTEYLQTGVVGPQPRKGYVIVQFKWVSQGCSLIHEDDLELLDRCINFGSYVKRPDDTMCGTVIGASATCTLEPIAYRNYDESLGEYGSVEFNEWLMPRSCRRPEADSSRPLPIHDVPLSELMHHEPFINDDLIIYRQKLGIIRQVDRDAILRVSSVPVSLVDPKALEVPCPFDDNELIWMPKDQPCRVVDTNLRYMEQDYVIPGQYVCTKYKNMRGINGGTVPKEDPRSFAHGHVLSTPATEYKVEWLCTNVFGLGTCEIPNGIETLRASVLERDAVICDFENSTGGTVKSATSLQIGDMIRFRDPKSSSQKYSYQHIPPEETFGYDMNMFHITSRKTALTVRWLDGSVTTEDIKCLRWDPGLDENIWPGSIVVLKDGIETINWPGLEFTSAYIRQLPSHRRHRESKIRARTVGVVQAVNIRERIVTVRWYKDPYLILLHGGQILASLYSKLGELGDTISQVSLYELDVFPCLERSHGDIVLLAPDTIHNSVLTEGPLSAYNVAGPCTFSYTSSLSLSQMHSYLKDMSLAMFHWEWFKSTTTVDTTPLPPRHSHHYQRKLSERSTADFVGQIIAIDANGEITVRLAGTCRDVRVPLERIMMVMDGGFTTPLGVPAPGDLSTMSMNSAYTYKEGGPGGGDEEGLLQFDDEEGISNDDEEDMSETTLQEALRRYVNGEEGILFDDDDDLISGNDEEEGEEAILGSDVEDMSEIKCAVYRYVNSGSTDAGYSEDADIKTGNDSDFDMRNASDGVIEQSEEVTLPPGFTILEGAPPSDHHFISRDEAGGSTLRTKRIQREYDILGESLPPGIYVRAWESRMDLLRVLFIGPEGTPYEYAPIVIDFHFPGDFPGKPPEAFFHSWIGGQGRINPNLYEDGKICLSILGTWPTQNPEEMWSATKSTVLQVLVSIMGLVLVQSPFYNEAGYEVFAAEGGRRVESDKYTEKTFLTTRRYIKYALDHQVSGMEDIVAWNYLPSRLKSEDCSRPLLLRRAIDTALAMIEHYEHTGSGEERSASAFVSRLSLGAVVMLRKYITELEALEVAATA
ncbi:hypothetical protein AtubIFM57258_005544 [Aspergillus tubingensis]|nr:hypothetical protein AtubIFM57258_005544 [Aspergillus tubingensis]